jgi:hypothetical protein
LSHSIKQALEKQYRKKGLLTKSFEDLHIHHLDGETPYVFFLTFGCYRLKLLIEISILLSFYTKQ